MKIVSSGKVLNSPKFYEKKKRKERLRLILALVSLLVVVFLFVYLSRHEKFLITEVVVKGENIRDTDEITTIVSQLLGQRYLWVIPKNNIALMPRGVIKDFLYQKFPKFKSINLDIEGWHTLNIYLEEHVPFALYCREALSPVEASECYFIDEEGLIFDQAPSFSNAVFFVYATSEPKENPLGEKIIPTEELKLLSEFIKSLATLDIYPLAVEIADDRYSLVLPSGGKIIWRRDADLALIHLNLSAFLSDEAIKSQSNFLERMSQLDLRTENKVFYRFQ
jgi:hypothetical protein